MVLWEKDSGPHVSKSSNYGEVIKEVDSYYHVETDKETYFFLINDFQIDDSNAEKLKQVWSSSIKRSRETR
jgi:hypothetical protein